MVRTVLIHEFASGGGLAGVEGAPPSWKAEGSAMRRALAEDFSAVEGIRVVMTRDAILPDEPGPWEVVRVGPGEELETFERLSGASDFTLLVAPESDGILLDRAHRIEVVGGRSLGSTLPAIALSGDKALLARRFVEREVASPRSILVRPKAGLPADFPYPAVLKPIDGAGSIDTFVIGRPDRIPPQAMGLSTALLQRFEAGEPWSAAFLVGSDGVPRLVGFGRQEIGVREGRISYLGGSVPASPSPPMDLLVAALAVVPGLRGWVGIDFLCNRRADALHIIEINPRVTTSLVGFRQLLDSGTIASAWLKSIEDPGSMDASELARRVRRSPPIAFDADGRISPLPESNR